MAHATATIHIDAPPETVYAMIADVPRTPEWSPEAYRVRWLGAAQEAVPGARFKGSNRFGMLRWSMVCELETVEKNRCLVWHTRFLGKPNTRWTYRFEAADGGSRVTEEYESVTPIPQPLRALYERLFRSHTEWMPENLERTLERVKAAAETAG